MDMLIQKDWKIIGQAPPGSLLDRVLAVRGLTDGPARQHFLDLSIEHLHDPFLMPGMDIAADRLVQAVRSGEHILIHGDYDVDGLTATALLTRLLRSLGAPVACLIPDRVIDGYGISRSGVMQAIEAGVTLLVTVDCGISAAAEIDNLANFQVDTILTDHHECPEQLPRALVILNPHLPGNPYPFKNLCGAGVAYKLAQALCCRLGCPGREQAYLDLAAVGTIADVVALTGENRILAAHGLALVQTGSQVGISAMVTASGLAGKPITAGTVGFSIAPRLNAAGRMGDANRALDLLLTDDPLVAASLAEELIAVNKDRQTLEAAIFSEAVEEIDRQQDFSVDEPIIVAKDGWQSGVIGIVAARLAEQYQRPAIVFAGEDGIYKGSGRTSGSFDLLTAIESASRFTIRYGGHRKAAGLTVAAEQMADFRRALIQYSRDNMDPAQLKPALTAELAVSPDELTLDAALDMEQLMPYGEENRQPAFILPDVRLVELRPVGNGRHFRFLLQAERAGMQGPFLEGIGFGLSGVDEDYAVGDSVDVYFHLEVNRFNGKERVSLQIRDLRPSQSNLKTRQAARQGQIPELADFRIAYQYLSSRFGQRPVLADLTILGRRISRSYEVEMAVPLLRSILTVFAEAGLVRYWSYDDDRVRFQLLPTGSDRVRLQDVPSYQRLIAQGGNES